MARIKIIILLICFVNVAAAQLAPGKYWILFTDKHNTPYSTEHPEDYLSQHAIDRRARQNIPVDRSDLPVNPFYVSQVLQTGNHNLLYTSKWFNAMAIASEDSVAIQAIELLPFVAEVREMPAYDRIALPVREEVSLMPRNEGEDYGNGYHQLRMLNGHLLHNDGYTGQGVRIGVMDGGFNGADQMAAFENVINSGRLLGTYDFTAAQEQVFYSSSHGTRVWSAMAANWPDSLIGTAPDASYFLFLTENVSLEYQMEECNWIAAAEMADSAGVDVLNTSLGYTRFQDSTQNYSSADLDGNTSWISRAGNMAARKGMLVVNSAGNSGSGDWYYIGMPADADSVLAIGAVRADSTVAAFSSRGPSADGRVKPNACAQGIQTALANTNNTMMTGNGTSFSSPVITGLAACLWQTNPGATAMQVFQAIEESAHLFHNPNDSMGFGIPDFFKAKLILEQKVLNQFATVFNAPVINVFPNPIQTTVQLIIESDVDGLLYVEVYDVSGKQVLSLQQQVSKGRDLVTPVQLQYLNAGVYNLRVRLGDSTRTIKLVKSQ
jgi:hypothetical protein